MDRMDTIYISSDSEEEKEETLAERSQQRKRSSSTSAPGSPPQKQITLSCAMQLLCSLCSDLCSSVGDLRNHLRSSHAVNEKDLGEYVDKSMEGHIKKQDSMDEEETPDEDEGSEDEPEYNSDASDVSEGEPEEISGEEVEI